MSWAMIRHVREIRLAKESKRDDRQHSKAMKPARQVPTLNVKRGDDTVLVAAAKALGATPFGAAANGLPTGFGTADRSRRWRRRALSRKGARLYASVSSTRDFVSLAMLDEDGIVVAWYDHAHGANPSGNGYTNGHVVELYMPDDVARGRPGRDLYEATVGGSSTREGWRRACDGAAFWANTAMRPIFLADGRLQGFALVTHRRPAPRRHDRDRSNQPGWFQGLLRKRIGATQPTPI